MKNFFFVLTFLCLTFPAFAQFSIGVSAGANLSFWKWPLESLGIENLYEPGIGWRADVLGAWQISPAVGLRAETGFQLKNNKIDLVFEDDSQGVGREHYLYWEGSLLLQLSPIKKNRNIYLVAGCTAGHLTRGWRTISGAVFEGGDTKQPIEIDTPIYNRNAIAADFGIGGNLPLSPKSSIKIEGRYQHSLSNFVTTDNLDTKVSPLILSVGYLHRL